MSRASRTFVGPFWVEYQLPESSTWHAIPNNEGRFGGDGASNGSERRAFRLACEFAKEVAADPEPHVGAGAWVTVRVVDDEGCLVGLAFPPSTLPTEF